MGMAYCPPSAGRTAPARLDDLTGWQHHPEGSRPIGRARFQLNQRHDPRWPRDRPRPSHPYGQEVETPSGRGRQPPVVGGHRWIYLPRESCLDRGCRSSVSYDGDREPTRRLEPSWLPSLRGRALARQVASAASRGSQVCGSSLRSASCDRVVMLRTNSCHDFEEPYPFG